MPEEIKPTTATSFEPASSEMAMVPRGVISWSGSPWLGLSGVLLIVGIVFLERWLGTWKLFPMYESRTPEGGRLLIRLGVFVLVFLLIWTNFWVNRFFVLVRKLPGLLHGVSVLIPLNLLGYSFRDPNAGVFHVLKVIWIVLTLKWFASLQKIPQEILEENARLKNPDGKFAPGGGHSPKEQVRGMDFLIQSAEQGNATAMLVLIKNYQDGLNGAERSPELAFKWACRLAATGDPKGDTSLGLLYQEGIGCEKDPVGGFALLQKGAASGIPILVSHLGIAYEQGIGVAKDEKKAFELFLQAAELGLDVAQLSAAEYLLNGPPGTRDLEKALELLEKAAAADYSPGLFRLGQFWYHGQGGCQDRKKAFAAFLKAAELGHPEAQKVTGTMYFHGDGVQQNFRQAQVWLVESARAKESADTLTLLGALYLSREAEVCSAELGCRCLTRASELGDRRASFQLGRAYLLGLQDLPKNPEEALKWLTIAEQQGAAEATLLKSEYFPKKKK